MKYSSLKQTKILFWSFEKRNLFWNKKISQARLYQILQPYPYIFIRTFTKKHTYHSTQKSNHYPLEGAWSFAYQAVNNWASLTAFYEVKKVIFFSSNWSTQISSPVNKSIRINFIRKIQIWEFRKKLYYTRNADDTQKRIQNSLSSNQKLKLEALTCNPITAIEVTACTHEQSTQEKTIHSVTWRCLMRCHRLIRVYKCNDSYILCSC